mmetsp:Transcript_19712/g.45882  ORF Transcript_19712/g.45882 Transcript_19712/m.45882 type:complete len:149 (-) Transcript_19712:715-1161(-)
MFIDPNLFEFQNVLAAGILVPCTLLLYIKFFYPTLQRETDILFIAGGLLYSFIMILHGWRLDAILLLSQLIIEGMATVYILETIRLRGVSFCRGYNIQKANNSYAELTYENEDLTKQNKYLIRKIESLDNMIIEQKKEIKKLKKRILD